MHKLKNQPERNNFEFTFKTRNWPKTEEKKIIKKLFML